MRKGTLSLPISHRWNHNGKSKSQVPGMLAVVGKHGRRPLSVADASMPAERCRSLPSRGHRLCGHSFVRNKSLRWPLVNGND